jgi:hypothetical protein
LRLRRHEKAFDGGTKKEGDGLVRFGGERLRNKTLLVALA